MSKYNLKTETKVENLAGGVAYKQSEKMQLISHVLTSFVKDDYYRTEKQALGDLEKLFNKIDDKKFIAKLAIYARKEFGNRSISHLLASLVANKVKGEQWTRLFFKNIVKRVDDITEILSCYIGKYGRKSLPNSLRRGLRDSFFQFDEYQLAKYKSEKKDLKLIDAVNLLRPTPNDKNKDALKKLVDNELVSFDTWKSELSSCCQGLKTEKEKNLAKEKVWTKLLSENKIGYFALLRNLRNILQQCPKCLSKAIELLTDENLIKKSLVLPYRFTTALKEIPITERNLIAAINKAIEISCNNVPKFDGNTLVVCDYSRSMGDGYDSHKGKASLFGAILAKKNNADFMIFGDDAKYIDYNLLDSVSTLYSNFTACNTYSSRINVGYGTNFHSIFQSLNKSYDRIFIFSDMQGWIGNYSPVKEFNLYKSKYDCNPFIYSIDLAGYGTLQFPENNVFCLAGFSEKIFNLIKLLEQDKNALINEIEKINL